MIGLAWWQAILNGLGWLLAKLYDFIPNYGIAIILLTVLIRILLLPLGIKQVRSMQAMAALQPKIKAIQQKHKGNKQKQTEETQRLYQEAGVNPLAGCLPLLLQAPVLIALYAVLRFPGNVGAYVEDAKPPLPHSHIPTTSRLYEDTLQQRPGTRFLGTNLLCSAGEAGKQIELKDRNGKPYLNPETKDPLPQLDCGTGIPVRIPYYVLALLMVGTTYFQQRQLQRANPAGAQQQQQALTRIMPLLFGVWGFIFPAGLVVYYTTSNAWQIGQQHFMIRAQRRSAAAAGDGKAAPAPAKRKGWFMGMMERAQQQQQARQGGKVGAAGKPEEVAKGSSSKRAEAAPPTPVTGNGSTTKRATSPSGKKPGGKNAGSRKKRRKR